MKVHSRFRENNGKEKPAHKEMKRQTDVQSERDIGGQVGRIMDKYIKRCKEI